MKILKKTCVFKSQQYLALYWNYAPIHPSSTTDLESGCRGNSLGMIYDVQATITPAQVSTVPSQLLQCVLGLLWGLLPVGHVWNPCLPPPNAARRLGGIQKPEPPQLTSLDAVKQQLYSKQLPGDRVPHPIPKGAYKPSCGGNQFEPLVCQIAFFWSPPKSRDHNLGWEHRSTYILRASLSGWVLHKKE